MENARHIIITGRNISPELEDRYLRWYYEVYCPNYVKIPGLNEVDSYVIMQRTLEYPKHCAIMHFENRPAIVEFTKHPLRNALAKDFIATFSKI